MNGKTLLRWGMLLTLMAVFVGGLIFSVLPEEAPSWETCLGVRMLSELEMSDLGSYQYRDYSENLKFQSEFAAVDQEASVIYIPQKIDKTTKAADLKGLLTIDVPGRELSFAPDANWENLDEAVRSGHAFKLLVSGLGNTYMKYHVVFTTLPVISMHGQLLYKDSEGRDVLTGRITLWDSENSGTLSSCVHWNIRGKSASYQEKKPWKLSLKNLDGKNNSENLLELGSDDDWILNAMNMEDSNVREKLFMDLWNEMAADTAYNDPMSRGEYVEVLVNGEYAGLYLLQRRVDAKYLELDKEAVLLKVKHDGGELSYEFVSSQTGDDAQKLLVSAFFEQGDCEKLSAENFVDVSLFLQLFCTKDNLSYKNMFYLFRGETHGYQISLIPWDTDAACGVGWNAETAEFIYDYDDSITAILERRELPQMERIHPQLKQRMNARWQELRKTVFSQDNLFEKLDRYFTVLESSGAPARDQEKWGLFFGGEDTSENLYRFVEERLAVLDQYYSE